MIYWQVSNNQHCVDLKLTPNLPTLGIKYKLYWIITSVAYILGLVATFLEAGGAESLPAMESRSLWPLLKGQAEATRSCVFSALEDWRVAFDGRYKLVAWGDASRRAMYDLQTDPSETCDISGSAGFDEIQSALVEHLRSYA